MESDCWVQLVAAPGTVTVGAVVMKAIVVFCLHSKNPPNCSICWQGGESETNFAAIDSRGSVTSVTVGWRRWMVNEVMDMWRRMMVDEVTDGWRRTMVDELMDGWRRSMADEVMDVWRRTMVDEVTDG